MYFFGTAKAVPDFSFPSAVPFINEIYIEIPLINKSTLFLMYSVCSSFVSS